MGILATSTQVKFSDSDGLDKIILQVGAEDILAVLRAVAIEEIGQQINIGNKPTNLLVDNRSSRSIEQAQRRVQAFFVDVELVYKAVIAAWQRALGLTRSRTGKAQASYQLWFNDRYVANTPGAARQYLDNFKPGEDYFRIVGPVVAYGRKLYWSPRGTPRFERKSILKTKNLHIKIVRVKGIMNLVAAAMRKRFRGVAVYEAWVTTSALPKDGRTPGVVIGFKRRGKLTSTV